jgi:predicted dithiol-disulfide oxidoreductase (DUF899 family)
MTITFPGESAAYRAARERLLTKEIELRRATEAVAVARRALPPGGLVPRDYVFDGLGHDGAPTRIRLSELFAPDKDTLVIYTFMFPRMPQDERPGPTEGATARLERRDGPCPSCTAMLDSLDGAVEHVEAAGFNIVVVANAPLDRLVDYALDRGWRRLRLLSARGNSFKRDYGSETPEGYSLPLTTVFQRTGDEIRHFWTSELTFAPPDPGQDSRQNGTLDLLWSVMDLTPEGRPVGWHEQVEYDCCHDALPARPTTHDSPGGANAR